MHLFAKRASSGGSPQARVTDGGHKKLQAEYREKALTALEKSFALGNRDFYTARLDADLISIRNDPRYGRVMDMEHKYKKR